MNCVWIPSHAVVHVLFFGSSTDTSRRLLHGPSFFLSHSVLAGWSQLTYLNPQIDLQDKTEAWGSTWRMSLPRTVVVHVLTVVAHWAVLLSERDDLRRLHAGMGLKELIARGVAPQLALLVLYVRGSDSIACPIGAACLPPRRARPRSQGQLFHSLTKTYGIKTVSNDRLHKLQV